MRILSLTAVSAACVLLPSNLFSAESAPAFDPVKEKALVTEIHKKVSATHTEKAEGDMKLYTNTIPGTTVAYAMVPIKGGEFLMGSPEKEAGRNKDEGPQHKVKVDPFWMGQCEVTWDEYELFMYPDQNKPADKTHASDSADITAKPTKPYVEMSFSMGKNGYPAISMTQHAANKYCEWLSAKTGQFYRLPTEAEWEYACRAGTTTAYSFGDDPAALGDYAWFLDNCQLPKNADLQYQQAGKKKPNPWGLYDMHGNVAEWCLDQYDAKYYEQFKDLVSNPWNKAKKPYPHVARGGGWGPDGDPTDAGLPEKHRSAARMFSHKDWKTQDPQLPKSIWYMTDAKFLGFRLVRPLTVPTGDEMYNYWNSGVEQE